MHKKITKYIILTLFILVLDRLTKQIILSNFNKTTCVTVIPHMFDFVFVENTGAAFSMLSGKTVLLGIISILFCIALLQYWIITEPKSKLVNIAFSFLFAGALGNAIDRIIRGSVVDFIQTTFIDFPVFNVADIAITFGAVFLMIYFLFFDKGGKKNGKNHTDGI